VPAYKLVVAYEGTDFVGWQRQASGTSIQGLLEQALGDLDGRPVAVVGAGRTDAGVHALGQTASCVIGRDIDAETLARAVNARLPPSVRVISAALASPRFHARFSARSKTYRYQIWNGDVMHPLLRRVAWHAPGPLAFAVMDQAARVLEGRHDFAAFQSAGGDVVTTERELTSSKVSDLSCEALTSCGGRLIVYEAVGDGFLRHMVRAIAGSLVEVGRGRRSPDWLREVLASRARDLAGPTLPAHGLVLVSVRYDDDLAAPC
jgi:tRNA pseudouridine38-40 synthase